MTYIIAEPCVGTCDTACVEVWPVDCIHGPHEKDDSGEGAKKLKDAGENIEGLQLYINPEEALRMNIAKFETRFIQLEKELKKSIEELKALDQ